MEWYYIVLIAFVSLLVLFLFVCFLMGYLIYKNTIPVNEKKFHPSYGTSTEEQDLMNNYYKSETERLKSLNMEEVYIRSFDGLKLHGYLKKALGITKKTIILVHGYSGSALDTAPKYSSWLTEYNYNLLFIDLRGCGKSEGKYITYGINESRDLVSWINYLSDRFNDSIDIALFGVSMGGNAILNLSNKSMPSVKAMISDSGYTSAKDQFEFMLKTYKHVPLFFLSFARLLIKSIAKFDLYEFDARLSLKDSMYPCMFIHSTIDNFVPYYMGKENYEACSSAKEMHTYNNCPHVRCEFKNREEYRKSVLDFLVKYL